MTQIRGGPGVRARQIGDRAVLSAYQFQSLDHAWRVLDGFDGYTVELGLVNELEPFIDGRPMSGIRKDGTADPRGAPVLAPLRQGPFPYWICIRVRVDRDGKFAAVNPTPDTLSIITSPVRISADPLVGLRPIAVVRLVDGVPDVHQIGRFDYQHLTSKSPKGRIRHHFQIA